MLSASRMACLIEATVESMLTMTPFFKPREGWVPMPMMSRPSGPISPTTAAILVVPMSSPTMMSEDLRGMVGCRLPCQSVSRSGAVLAAVGGVTAALLPEITGLCVAVDFLTSWPAERGRGAAGLAAAGLPATAGLVAINPGLGGVAGDLLRV